MTRTNSVVLTEKEFKVAILAYLKSNKVTGISKDTSMKFIAVNGTHHEEMLITGLGVTWDE